MGLLLLTYNLVSIAILVSPVRREKEDGAMWWEESWSQSKGDLFLAPSWINQLHPLGLRFFICWVLQQMIWKVPPRSLVT